MNLVNNYINFEQFNPYVAAIIELFSGMIGKGMDNPKK